MIDPTLKTSDLKENGKYPVINSGRELYGFYDEYNNNLETKHQLLILVECLLILFVESIFTLSKCFSIISEESFTLQRRESAGISIPPMAPDPNALLPFAPTP